MCLLWLAHPLRGFEDHSCPALVGNYTAELNITNAQRWLKVLQIANPGVVLIAPWIGQYLAWPEVDSVPAMRRAAIGRNLAVIKRCDGLVLVGGRITEGMLHEADFAEQSNKLIFDLTHLGYWAPSPKRLTATANLGAAISAAAR